MGKHGSGLELSQSRNWGSTSDPDLLKLIEQETDLNYDIIIPERVL